MAEDNFTTDAESSEFDTDLLKYTSGRAKVMDPFALLGGDWKKFVGLTHDLHDIRNFLDHIRLCFLALTISTYIGVVIFLIVLCCKSRAKKRRAAMRRKSGANRAVDYQADGDSDREANGKSDWEELHTVRTEASNHYRFAPPPTQRQRNHLGLLDSVDNSTHPNALMTGNGKIPPLFIDSNGPTKTPEKSALT